MPEPPPTPDPLRWAYPAPWAPGGFYMRIDDNIRVTSYNSLAGVTLSVRTRFLTLDGLVQASVDAHTPNTDRTAASSILVTPEGWLLGLEVFASAGTPQIGQTFVVLEAVRGLASSATPLQLFTTGYCTSKQPLAWPAVSPGQSLDGHGALRSIAGTTPGAGAEFSETVPTGARWELIMFHGVLNGSAAVANRLPRLVLDDGANQLLNMPGIVTTTANAIIRYEWAQGMPFAAQVNAQQTPTAIPVGNRLGAGFRLRSITTALDVGDTWTNLRYLVREWIEGN